ncbi:cation:proton antiporter [Oligoflexus tunisiensis]|uniref:cation:proton antiporter n=1 Tax=Oligoflexus tunisiensis TaxID=708132 RepID=UPI000AA021D5|nr:sodium:proton antiporter [Oligoflexus tunisiensis]
MTKDLFNLIAILTSTAAAFAFLNQRYIKLPMAVGLMALSVAFSLILLLLNNFGLGHEFAEATVKMLHEINFSTTVMQGMLCFLLFAGALHVEIEDLKAERLPIAVLATVGVALSTAIVGFLIYGVGLVVGLDIPLAYALLFGSLISPTDPVAVLSILKSANVSRSIEIKITGESLFNDGAGIVIFLAILGYIAAPAHADAGMITKLVLTEVVGGIMMGLAAGYGVFLLLRKVDDYRVEILMTLALVTGLNALSTVFHTSGPLAVVVAGLLIGNHGKKLAMSDISIQRLEDFWELLDELINAMLFVLIGLELMVLTFSGISLLFGFAAIPVVLLARWVSVAVPITLMQRFRDFSPRVRRILWWGGLRGGVSVALALQIPTSPQRDALLVATYCVVVFSILVQGLTIKRMAGSQGA